MTAVSQAPEDGWESEKVAKPRNALGFLSSS